MSDKENSVCEFCGHTLENNRHGLDQNDAYYDSERDVIVHSGVCTYCKLCTDKMIKEMLKR
jgi:hypothetical protein